MLPRTIWLSLGLAAGLLACGGGDPARPPNVLLVTLDTTRADRLSPYGAPESATPALASLARAGTLFEHAYCDVTYTTPSMASTLTGTWATRHRLRFWSDTLPDAATTLAERLRAAGYRTAAVIGSFALHSRFRLDQGFEVYDEDFSAGTGEADAPGADSHRSDARVSDRAAALLAELAGDGGAPFFLWVHYYGPHADHRPDRSAAQNLQHHARTYDAKLARTDRAVGRLLDALDADADLAARTFVVVHADHGESLGEHRYIGHGRLVTEPILRVPLILRWPGVIPAGHRIQALVGNIDIAPTVLEAAGVAVGPDDGMDGRSLWPLIRGGAGPREELYFETYMPANRMWAEVVRPSGDEPVRVGVRRAGVLRPPWKLVTTRPHPLVEQPDASPPPADLAAQVTRDELFHLGRDPGERAGAIAGSEADARRAALLRRLSTYTAGEAAAARPEEPLAEDEAARLRSLGYLE